MVTSRCTVTCVSTVDGSYRPRQSRCTTPDDVGIAVYDFGGRGPDLLLVHATGFCAEVFTPLARHLGDSFHCFGLDLRAHGASDRPPDGIFAWSGFATDVLAVVDHLGLASVSGFGHSCGGASLLLAELDRPRHVRIALLLRAGRVARPGRRGATLVRGQPVDRRRPAAAGFVPLGRGRLRQLLLEAALFRPRSRGTALVRRGGLRTHSWRRRRRRSVHPVAVPTGGRGHGLRLRRLARRVRPSSGDRLSGGAGLRGTDRRLRPVVPRGRRGPAARSSIEVLPGLGHFGPLQRPEAVAASVARSLNPVSDTPSP